MSDRKSQIKATLICILMLTAFQLSAAPLSGNYNVGTGQTYTSLSKTGGFFAAVNANGLSGNVTVKITSDLTTEDGTIALNKWTETGAGGYTIIITSSAAALRTISGNPARPIILFNDANRVTFDGRFAGSGKYLTFRNTNGSNAVFWFQNDASNNTITYCTIESNNAAGLGVSATIVFAGTTITTGNNNNTISFCDIRDRSDAAGQPINAILASGTVGKPNSNNTITNCNIYNTYNAASTYVNLYIGDGNTDWIISNNSFYQTSARNPASGAAYFGLILATSGNNFQITGNYFGGMAPNCGGGALTMTTGSGLFAFRIFQTGTTTATVVQNNTIANIDCTLNTSGDYFFFRGIDVNVSGLVNVTGNTIGSTSAANSIILRYNGTFGNPDPTAIAYGYYWNSASTITGTVSNNNIGGISLTGTGTTADDMDFIGIRAGFSTAFYASNVTISGNTIGNNLASNFQNALNVNTTFMGINTNVSSPGVVTVSNNTIRNLTDGTTNALASLRGIFHDGNATFNCTGNTITEIKTSSTNITSVGADPNNAVNGISVGINSTGANTVTGNTISGIRSLTAGATNTSSKGLVITGNCSGTVGSNKIYDLTNVSTGAGASLYGLYIASGSMTAQNNMITITNGELSDNIENIPIPESPHFKQEETELNPKQPDNSVIGSTSTRSLISRSNPNNSSHTDKSPIKDGEDSFNGMVIQGIHDEGTHTWNIYYNTVYIGGTVNTGVNLTSAYHRDAVNIVTLKDNLFYNNRTGNGTHLAINNNNAGGTFTGNYNVLISSSAATIGRWNGTNETIAAWRTASGSDKLSWSTTSATILAANLFTSISTGNLHVNSANTEAWIVSGKGIALATVTTDVDGVSRSASIAGGVTDIGADEFAATPPNNPGAVVDFAPASGVTSTYTLWGRTIAVINWGTGGSTYPSSVKVQYYSGVNPPGVVGGHYSNSNWVLTPTGTLTGASYDITYDFGDNETFTITTPNTSSRLAKYNTSWEVFSTMGTGVYQTDLTWANLTIKSRGMSSFSTYALTDINSPLPVTMLYFNASMASRDVKLNWATSVETNNAGFEIQRRSIAANNNFTDWSSVAFVNGKGTTNQESDYNYSDGKLSSGTYQYRLKQVDFNGNFAYFNLNSPANVIIGVPSAFNVFQNYPNPSNPSTKIDFQLPFAGKVSLKVYDVSGREVATVLDRHLESGYYTNEFDGSNTASGVYFYRLVAVSDDGNTFSKTMKMIVVK